MRLPDVGRVAVDTETGGLHPDDHARVGCIGLAWEGGSIAIAVDQGIRDKLPAEQLQLGQDTKDPNISVAQWRRLLVWLGGRDLVFHGAKFDLTMLKVGTRLEEGVDLLDRLVWDTMLAARELDPIESVSLDASAQRAGIEGKMGLDQVKAWLKQNKQEQYRYDLAPWHLIKPYVLTDAEITWKLYKAQMARYQQGEQPLDRLVRELDLLRALYQIEHRGIGYDSEASLEAAEVLEKRADEIEAGMPFKCTPNGAKKWFLEGGRGQKLESSRQTKGGAPSLDDEQIREWIADGVDWAQEYQEVTKARRAVSMWYRGYAEKRSSRDGRLRCTFKQSTVKSGRMAVERVQLQSIPKSDKALGGVPEVRSLVRPAEGKELWNLDLSQAELRVAAKYAGCRRMLEMLEGGADLHGITCEQVLRVKRDSKEWKSKRDIAKRLTFASIFQVGGDTFQAELRNKADMHLSLPECKRLVSNWRGLYPEFGTAYYRAMRMSGQKGYVRLLPNTEYETRSYFQPHDMSYDRGAGLEVSSAAWSRIVQGSLAEFFKLWLIEIEKREQWRGYAVLLVHDSVLLETPAGEGRGIAEEIAAWAAVRASNIFNVEMKVDIGRWEY